MRIGFDATAIPPNRAGAGMYIFQLARTLALVDTRNEYFVFGKSEYLREMAVDRSNFHPVPVDLTSTWRRMLWEQSGLPAQIRKLGLQLLHSPHYTMPVLKPCPNVVTFCDMTFYLYPEVHDRGRRLFFRNMMRWSAHYANRLIAISESTRTDVIRILKAVPENITTVPLAAGSVFRRLSTEDTGCVCARYGLTPGRFLLFVGVLEPRKNVPALLQAYARLIDDFPDFPLVITGKKGWLYDEIFRQVTALNLKDRVRFPGYVVEEDLIALYNGARAFIYPSLYEGFGLPVLEALQCGSPVITSNISSMPEIARDAALLIPPDDVAALTSAIRLLLTDEELAQRLSMNGLKRAEEFSWQRCAQETIEVYRSLGAD